MTEIDKSIHPELERLHSLRAISKHGGGPDKIKRQHDRGKLTARERLDLLFDPNTFYEIGILGAENHEKPDADGVVAGYGKIDGRYAGVVAYDYTVKGGSMGQVGEEKATRIREIAMKSRFPMIWLSDSGGARIDPKSGFGASTDTDRVALFANTGYLFKEESLMSGVIPLVGAMLGPGFAGTAYIPGLSDFVPMVKGKSFMGLAGPALVKMVIGEDIDENELGGSKMHCEVSGVGDLEVEDDAACIQVIRDYLSFFPANCDLKPPRKEFSGDPLALIEDQIATIVPDNTREAYNMHRLIKLIVDDKFFFEMKPRWGKNMITGFGRIGGYPLGIVANNPMSYGGVIDINASDKAARFIWLCDAFNIPLLFLSDVPGFMVGSKAEKDGIIRHGAKFIHAVAEATVPKFTIIVRKSYGAGYYAMCGKAFDPDLIVAWPKGEISVMGAEGMISIFARKALEEAPEEDRAGIVSGMAAVIKPLLNVKMAAAKGYIDDIIDPRETRRVLFQALEFTKDKKIFRHPRKHGVYPV
ncbi:MAG: acyl-CoA carboxylase subunit beta [Clostridia bacterium]|nr:acyl-CoA carboxylase subunit beta [Clostridia bacterium]